MMPPMNARSILLLGAISLAGAAIRQQPAFNAGDARVAIEKLAHLLEENFVYPDIGQAYSRMLRSKLASGTYASFPNAEEFAKVVTADLQGVNKEGHLRLIPPGTEPPGQSAAPGTSGSGVRGAGWLASGVAYMSIHGFQGDRAEYTRLMNRLREVLDKFSSAKTLIIDARPYVGGSLEETDIMASYFFTKPTVLLRIDIREAVEKRNFSPLVESETLRRIAGPAGVVRREQVAVPSSSHTGLRTARIFVLTSKQTASGGEGFTLALKQSGRATIIGETTAGAGHLGRTTDLGGGYRSFIPIGRPYDPTTGKGWEQTGVEPNVKATVAEAFDKAVRLAGADVEAAKKALQSLKPDQ